MTVFDSAWIWCVVQITILALAGAIAYLLARRLGPAVGSLIAATTLMLTSCLTMMAFLPLPAWTAQWFAVVPKSTSAAESRTDPTDPTDPTDLTNPTDQTDLTDPTGPTDLTDLGAFFAALRQELTTVPQIKSAGELQQRRWAFGGWIFTCIALLGLLRIAFSFRAVARVRQRTVLLREPRIQHEIDHIARQFDCAAPVVELRESSELTSAATWGWLRPIIVLPIEWRDWSPEAVRAVLAHELAHVLRRDYLIWLLAQIGVALHAYHPLVHWLARRLRQDQECAADLNACQIVGGPRAYLTVLATMAIEQDDRRLSWSAHPFLPSRRTFLRRIEMLRDLKRLPLPPTWPARWATVATLLLLAILTSGFRAIRSGAEAFGQPPQARAGQAAQPPASAQQKSIRFDYVPRDAIAVFAVRPAQIVSHPLFQKQADVIESLQQSLREQVGYGLEQIEQITGVMVMTEKSGRGPEQPCFIFRVTEPVDDVNALAKKLFPQATAEAYGEYQIYSSGNSHSAFPDNQTMIMSQDVATLRRLLVAGKDATLAREVAATWNQNVDMDAAAFINAVAMRPLLDSSIENAPAEPAAMLGAMAPLWQKTTAVAAGLQIGDTASLQVLANADNAENVKAVRDTLHASITLARNMLSSARTAASRVPGDQGATLLKSVDVAEAVLEQAAITEQGTLVVARSDIASNKLQETAQIVAKSVLAARRAARRATSQNNLKQIALAMHNYHDANNRFPAANVVGPDGKTVHSWRVALLPYLEQEPLYRQYRFDEPWDSPNNIKLVEQMPPVFRHPDAPEDTTSASYYALTGEQTMFPGERGTRFPDITDGTSNTIMFVEAKRDIPWTKPEDIPFDPNQPPAELGGFSTEGFNAAFGDGAVRFLSQMLDPNVLKLLIMRNDGNPIPPLD